MKKRIVAICMLAALLLGMLGMVGCQPSVSTATPNFVVPEGGFDPTQEVTITFGHTMGQASMAIVDKYIKEFNKIAVNVKRINCDYYMYNASPMDGINSYRGEYMSQYSWAEATNATILQIRQ